MRQLLNESQLSGKFFFLIVVALFCFRSWRFLVERESDRVKYGGRSSMAVVKVYLGYLCVARITLWLYAKSIVNRMGCERWKRKMNTFFSCSLLQWPFLHFVFQNFFVQHFCSVTMTPTFKTVCSINKCVQMAVCVCIRCNSIWKLSFFYGSDFLLLLLLLVILAFSLFSSS